MTVVAPGDGSKWTDERLDDLADEMDTLRDTQAALSRVPERVGKIEERTEAMLREQGEVKRDIRELRKAMERRFDDVDTDHAAAAKTLAKAAEPRSALQVLKETMVVIGPVLIALIAAYATIQAARGKP